MSLKYFYSCPLEAAFMSKHHGVQFVDFRQSNGYGTVTHSFLVFQANPKLSPSPLKKFWVHPDSHKIFNLQAPDITHNGMTIYRNKKAFIWPETKQDETAI